MRILSKALIIVTLICFTGCFRQPIDLGRSDSGVRTSNSEKKASSDETKLDESASESTSKDSKDEAISKLQVQKIDFVKTINSSGQITVGLNEQSAYVLKQTAPSEYLLTVPMAVAAEAAKLPKLAPTGATGIRSVRAVQEGDKVLVRMFVDAGTVLIAKPFGKTIVIEARDSKSAGKSNLSNSARGQLEKEDPAKASDSKTQAGDGKSGLIAGEGDEQARSNPTGVDSEDGSKAYMGRLISLDLQDTDIDNALRIIAEVSNLNIIASDDVSGKVTLRLIDVPWDQALDVILKTNGLDQVTEGNVIRIAPVAKLKQEREALLDAKRAQEQLEELKVKYIRISYARVDEMKEIVESVLSERGSVSTDLRTNQVIIKDIRKGQEEAYELIKRLDLRTPQVLLETMIVESSQSMVRDLGFQWNFDMIASPATGNALGYNFPNSAVVSGAVSTPANIADGGGSIGIGLESADGTKSLTARITNLETEGKAKVISRPQVATINNKEAEIKSVETMRLPLPDSGLSVATGAGASASGGAATAVEEIDVGIELRVTPQASPDYYVLLDIEAKSSTFSGTAVGGIPNTLEREATSTVLVKSGQTFALGGIYRVNDQDAITGISFLKDIPVLGHMFRDTRIDKNDQELIFFITPHIVEGSFDSGAM
jgi:type IV pilus assembly protein PilQ